MKNINNVDKSSYHTFKWPKVCYAEALIMMKILMLLTKIIEPEGV